MSSTILQAALDEQRAAVQQYRQLLQGMRDMGSDEINPDTKSFIEDLRSWLQHRCDLTQTACLANTALLEDGFPILHTSSVPAVVMQDLDAHLAAERAARALFTAQTESAVSTGSFTLGEPEPKPAA